MSKSGKRRSHRNRHQRLAPADAKPRLQDVADDRGLVTEPEPFGGVAMTLAYEECSDDRPPVAEPHSAGSGEVRHSHLARAIYATPQEHPGATLRRARESRGLTVEDLSRTTKISKATLTALESSDVLHLPAAIYTRGFVKSYAREVGLDPDSTADDYLKRIEPFTTHHLLVDDGELPPLADDARASVDPNEDARQLLAANQVRRFSRLGTVAAAVGLVIYLVSFNWQSGRQDQQADVSEGAAPISDAVPAANDTSRPVGPVNGPLRVELVPQGPCWLAVSVDGERVLARLLQPGERQTIEVSEEAVMRVGDPSALSISINGQTGRPLGPAGQPVNVRITKDNFREFLSS